MAQATQTVNDLGRLQQEAVARMMEMQRQAQPRGGWSTDPNVPKQNRAPRQEQPEPPPPEAPPQNASQQTGSNQGNFSRGQQGNQRRSPFSFGGGNQRRQSQHQQQQAPPPPAPEPEPAPKTDTTLLQDILGAVGLDDDRVLILGLILILINSKADTTLILALCYLLL